MARSVREGSGRDTMLFGLCVVLAIAAGVALGDERRMVADARDRIVRA